MPKDLAQRAQAIIKQIAYATVATSSHSGEPWNSPVYYAYDEHYNIYWGSHIGSQHSQNIRANGRAFLVIYNSTVTPGMGEGVYIQAQCSELTNPAQIAFAHELIQDRRHPIPYWVVEQVQSNTPIRLYKATPRAVWINDDGSADGNYIDIRTEVSLR